MCDYSMEGMATRDAKVGDRLVSTNFGYTNGFAGADEHPQIAVCLRPGTELVFTKPIKGKKVVKFLGFLEFMKSDGNFGATTARFRKVNEDRWNTHHDALELPDGQIVILSHLVNGQTATVLQLPATESPVKAPAKAAETAPVKEVQPAN